jgi:hypothetical protein
MSGGDDDSQLFPRENETNLLNLDPFLFLEGLLNVENL